MCSLLVLGDTCSEFRRCVLGAQRGSLADELDCGMPLVERCEAWPAQAGQAQARSGLLDHRDQARAHGASTKIARDGATKRPAGPSGRLVVFSLVAVDSLGCAWCRA